MTGPVCDVFTASNGYEVRTDADGTVCVFDDLGDDSLADGPYLDHLDLTALREFFQHERDRELGRWRWPEHPEYVVYPHGRSLGLDLINVINESWGEQYTFERIQRRPDSFLAGSPTAAAQAYFEAHPVAEPKPWENANDGEIWELTTDPAAVAQQYISSEGRFFRLPLRTPSSGDWKPANFASEFVDGRRIWSEVD